ncbi:MAG: hypothetical protein MJE77_05795 [Proteobacteria bacterium]|nr:hypothetical protein [Pseudomonadota bacterium]
METLQPGQVIDNYHIERELGSGGFGSVYQAVHGQIGRRVALNDHPPEGGGFG